MRLTAKLTTDYSMQIGGWGPFDTQWKKMADVEALEAFLLGQTLTYGHLSEVRTETSVASIWSQGG
jgi:hypothetical protein